MLILLSDKISCLRLIRVNIRVTLHRIALHRVALHRVLML